MRVPMQQNIALRKRQRMRLVDDMPVRQIDRPAAEQQKAVVREHRERQHHLVDLAVAVATHAENSIFQRRELRDHLLRGILPRQIVSRSVVKNVAEKHQPLGLLGFKRFEHARTPVIGAVQVGRNHQFHIGVPPWDSFFLYALFYRRNAKKRSVVFPFFCPVRRILLFAALSQFTLDFVPSAP